MQTNELFKNTVKYLQKDKNGFFILDEFFSKDKIENFKFNPVCAYVKINGLPVVFKQEKADCNYNMALAFKKNVKFDKNAFVNNDPYILGEMYLSRLANKMGIRSVEYAPAILDGDKGIISVNYNRILKDAKFLRNYIALKSAKVDYLLDDNLKFMKSKNVFIDCDEKVVDKLDALTLFDLTTLQLDRHGCNVVVGKTDNSEMPNDIVAFDYSTNYISLLGYQPKKLQKKLQKMDYQLIMGIDNSFSKGKDVLSQLVTSPYIKTKSIISYLEVLDSVLKEGTVEDIHAELKEDYGNLNTDFKDALSYTMHEMGEKIYKASEKRIELGMGE